MMGVQIGRVDECNVTRVKTLDFDVFSGACNTYQFDVEKILFCFGGADSAPDRNRQCYL